MLFGIWGCGLTTRVQVFLNYREAWEIFKISWAFPIDKIQQKAYNRGTVKERGTEMGIEFKTVNEYVIKYGGDMATKRILGDCACNHGNDAKALWKEFADYLGFKIKE